jgi:hypothetical protein
MRILPSFFAALLVAAQAFAGSTDPRQAFHQIPAWFEPLPGGLAYASRSASLTLSVDASGATLAQPAGAVRLTFPGARPAAALEGLEPGPATTQYLSGSNRAAWRYNVPHFEKVAARAVYPGVDVVYYTAGKNLEYDFVVQPGARPADIRLRFSGSQPVLDPDGSLRVAGGFRQHAPFAYQQRDGRRVQVAASYRLAGADVAFQIGDYDASLPLVIDPVLTWSGYFGGSQAEAILATAAAPDGSYWITGSSRSVIDIPPGIDPLRWTRNGTISTTVLSGAIDAAATSITVDTIAGFPATAPFNIRVDDEVMTVTDGAGTTTWTVVRGVENTSAVAHAKAASVYNYQPDLTTKDVFLARIAPDGAAWKLTYFTYIGGTSDDEATGIALMGNRIALTGTTTSTNFPVSANAFLTTKQEETDIFVLLYDPAKSGQDCLVFSSYYGGEKSEYALSIAAGPNGRLAVGGYTTSGFLQFVASGQSLQPANRGGVEGFVLVVQPLKDFPDSFLYSTYFGGSSTDIVSSVAFDAKGVVYFAGTSMSDDLPVSDNARYPYPFSVGDGFVAAIDPGKLAFDSFVYGSYFGGSDLDSIQAMALDAQGRIWVTGYTFSDDLPVSPGAYAGSRAGSVDAFLARLDPSKTGAAFVDYCTYFGGGQGDVPYAIAVDPASGAATIAGYTTSPDLPFKNIQGAEAAPIRITEIFAARFDPAQTAQDQLVWSAVLGGPGSDVATGLALDPAGNAFIAGYSNSPVMSSADAGTKPAKAGAPSGVFFRIGR